jgi:N utilization substance protein A
MDFDLNQEQKAMEQMAENFAEKEVVEAVQDERTEVSLEEARKDHPEAELGMTVIVESTPADFGRVAAQTARQVIQQRIRDAERQAQLDYYEKQLGEIISGVVQAVAPQQVTLGLDMKAEGVLPRNQQINGEHCSECSDRKKNETGSSF